jgi:hypothetical protein
MIKEEPGFAGQLRNVKRTSTTELAVVVTYKRSRSAPPHSCI